jgi:hypothetical protein
MFTARIKAAAGNADSIHMKCFALAAILSFAIPASALAQVPNPRALAPQEPRRKPLAGPVRPGARFQKMTPKQKIAGPKAGQRGAGVPQVKGKNLKRALKMKNGSK